MRTARTAESHLNSTSRYGYATLPTSSTGYSTPRETRKERWCMAVCFVDLLRDLGPFNREEADEYIKMSA